jgi:periplasmic divalent cation tolerance protein
MSISAAAVGQDARVSDYVQVMTTTDRREHADALADELVRGRLAACVQVLGPIQSTYRWQGDVERADEWLLVAKTTGDRLDAVVGAIGAHHHYDVPEITATPIVGGSRAYLDWIRASVT